ncbi:enhancer of polycomb-like-domain-containing protein [Halteromyces radiatus]|uniref:enhancer of polycomb-like-domain-containing protein n=1 Tax=Halteromyces radiatus TaxID=101107 RepID=UPI00221F3742|nr:enhancer of polycomb-like-domain-containing protein [Halteromyces radiatus]KAI8089939.1 enhancer of polycomb-like-domain-containing protein [Halteromyces radiatus]
MASQMVSRFRVKKLSPKHPLPVYKESQLPDLTDPTNLQRSVPQIETGVEKEEEEEHDLQAAISAAQAAVTTGAQVERYIPTPDASRVIPTKAYNSLYIKKFKEPSTLIRFSSTVEDCTGCPYVMDDDDDLFLKKFNKKRKSNTITEDRFEEIMWALETIIQQQLPHLSVDPSQLPDYDAFQSLIPPQSDLLSTPGFDDIFEHWRQRRAHRAGKPIIPVLQYEDVVKNEVDPYVCFRRRETKSVRKTRRTDQQSLERLRRLRNEMEMARNLLEMVLKREEIRKEGLMLEQTIFEKKCKFREYQRILGIKEDDDLLATPKKKRKGMSIDSGSGTTIKIPLNKLKRDAFEGRIEKSPIQLAIENEIIKKKEQDAPFEDVTECPYQPFPQPIPQLFYTPLFSPDSLSSASQPQFRRRLGRNGRLFLDRTGYHCRSLHDLKGKSKPYEMYLKARERYRFDTDYAFDDDDDDEYNKDNDVIEVDMMQDSYLQHRAQLLSEGDIRNLITIPFLTPSSMTQQKTVSSSHQPSISTSSSSISAPIVSSPTTTTSTGSPLTNGTNGVSSALSPTIIKRQNSRSRVTPQQAAVAMANGMMAANMAAAVNHSGHQNKSAIQMAMAAAQQSHSRQQQQQLSSTMNQSPIGSMAQQ